VTAIVEDDEYSDCKSSRDYCEWKSEPERNRNEKVHQVPQSRVRNYGINELPDGRPNGGLLIFADDVSPGRMSGDFVRDRDFAHRKC